MVRRVEGGGCRHTPPPPTINSARGPQKEPPRQPLLVNQRPHTSLPPHQEGGSTTQANKRPRDVFPDATDSGPGHPGQSKSLRAGEEDPAKWTRRSRSTKRYFIEQSVSQLCCNAVHGLRLQCPPDNPSWSIKGLIHIFPHAKNKHNTIHK